MKIAQIAPLMESCPPQLYGGTERVVSYLTEELVRQGHEVTLFANGDSITPAISFAHISDQWGTVFDIPSRGDHLGARNLLNASIAYNHGPWTVTAFGTNLMDDRYVAALISPLEMVGNPRQYGLSIMRVF